MLHRTEHFFCRMAIDSQLPTTTLESLPPSPTGTASRLLPWCAVIQAGSTTSVTKAATRHSGGGSSISATSSRISIPSASGMSTRVRQRTTIPTWRVSTPTPARGSSDTRSSISRGDSTADRWQASMSFRSLQGSGQSGEAMHPLATETSPTIGG